MFGALKHAVKVPRQNVKALAVKGTVYIKVSALGINISHKQLKGHPISYIFNIKVLMELKLLVMDVLN
jgi:hypothetical protein